MRLFTVFALCLFTAISLRAQNVTYITLKEVKSGYTPEEFFINKVIDDRNPRGAFGTVHTDEGESPIAVQNGIAASLNEFINRNVSQNRSKPSINLHLTSLNIIVKKTGSKWVTDASVIYTYYVGDSKLLEFSNSGQETSGKFSTDFTELFLRRSLVSGMKRFDEWCHSNKGRLVISTNKKSGTNAANSSVHDKNTDVHQSDKPYIDKPEETKAFELINMMRANPDKYLPGMGIYQYGSVNNTKLVWNEQLAKVAEAKAMDMAKRNYFAHVDPDGYGMNYYINKAGYILDEKLLSDKSNNYFESIQAGATDGDAAVRDLILDEGVPDFGHRKHLLGMDKWAGSLYDIGIGFVRSGAGSRYRTYTSVIIAKHK